MKICQISKKKPISGNSISKSNKKNKRWFKINIFNKKIYDVYKKQWIKIKISNYGLRILKKKGLKNIKYVKKK
ncbi:MAG: 50S ribosomal protein L28 [Candidatus Shikimatogenerans sp. JK-2022]|nr:50S ribosomal protein L28 [Candidatus Shikimatogenerans bostrichidophilus]